MRHNQLRKKLTAALLTISMTIGSVGMIPVSANADTEDTETVSVSGIETDFGDTASGDSDERDIDSEVAELLSNGDYVEGRAIVLYDTESTASSEELVGAGSLIGNAE